jgi:hypothetical protein
MMEFYDLMFVTIINTIVSKIDGWISSIIDHLFGIKKYLVELAYDIYYGPSLSVTDVTVNIRQSSFPKIAIESYNTIAEYLQLPQESFICQYGKIVKKPVNIGDDRLSVSFERDIIVENTTDENGDTLTGGQYCNYIVTIKSRIHTPDEFIKFTQNIIDRVTNTVTGKNIIDYSENRSYVYNLDETDKIYYPEIVDAISNVVSTKSCGNFLLHGPPGTGKTNLIKHIANKFNAVVFIINFNSISSASHFRQLLGGKIDVYDNVAQSYVSVEAERRFLLFEDFDSTKTKNFWAALANSKEKKKKPVPDYDSDDSNTWGCDAGENFTYADLINALDGFIKIPGAYTFWTTNYLEKINPSFYRPGRMHYTAYIGPLSTDRANEFVNDHFGDGDMITRESVTIAELHSILTQTSDRADFVAKINDMYLDKMMTGGIKTAIAEESAEEIADGKENVEESD